MLNYTSTYARKWGVKLDNEHWHDHAPKFVETNHEGKVTILVNQKVQTGRTIANNKPDIIVVIMKKEHIC